MILRLNAEIDEKNFKSIMNKLNHEGFYAVPIKENKKFSAAIIKGVNNKEKEKALETVPFLEKIEHLTRPFMLASRETKEENMIIPIKVEGMILGSSAR